MTQRKRSIVTILFGDNEKVVLNADCVAINLLEVLKRKIGLQHEINLVVDLADVDGNLKLLHRNLKSPANKFLDDGNYYIAVRKEAPLSETEHQTLNQQPNYIPLLLDCSRILPNYQVPTIVDASIVQPTPNAQHGRRKGIHLMSSNDAKKSNDYKKAVTIK